jgi:putative Mn2+ efflux pump MntP
MLIALGLAADAFAVSVSNGLAIKKMHLHHAMLIAVFFGGFQALMPFIGWLLGGIALNHIQAYDHWIAFTLLAFIGGKMIHDAIRNKDEEEEEAKDPLNIYILFIAAIATSIDAFAVGITFSILHETIITPVIIIGTVTFITSFAGTYIGNHIGHLMENKLEIFGGLILIGIGIKILLEHTVFDGNTI